MSINFEDQVNPEALEKMREIFGDSVVNDGRQFLFNKMQTIKQADMKAIANAAKQVATVELHTEGEVKTMADGTRYQVTPAGWRKLRPDD